MGTVHCPWSDYAPGTIDWCEERLCALVVEPSNAWSNIGYVIAGIAILFFASRKTGPTLVAIAGIVIGPASFAFHATGTRIGELIDVSAMYLLSGIGLAFAAQRLWSLSGTALVIGYVGIVAASIGAMIAFHTNGIFAFVAQVTATVLMEMSLYRRGRGFMSYAPYKWMVVSFATAFSSWILDKTKILCSPTNHLLTGHAVWHLLTAVALYLFARQQTQPLKG